MGSVLAVRVAGSLGVVTILKAIAIGFAKNTMTIIEEPRDRRGAGLLAGLG